MLICLELSVDKSDVECLPINLTEKFSPYMVFSPDGSEFYLLYTGAVRIDTPGPQVLSFIDFRDSSSFRSLGNFTISEVCTKLVLAFN